MSYLNWHVGMKVVCVKTPRHRSPCEAHPIVGRVYTIRSTSADEEGVFVRLDELRNPVLCYVDRIAEVEFEALFFRPVQPRATDISIFTAMLTDQRQKEKA